MFNEIERFVNWIRRRNPTAYTWKSYTYDLHQFVEIVGDKDPADITLHDIDSFIETLANRNLQSVTINRRIATVTSLYRFLADEDPELVSPVIPHRHTLRTPRRLPRSAPQSEIEKLFATINTVRDQAIFLLMLRCGLRISEVSQLNLTDLYFDEQPHRLVVRGKNSKERSVYLSPQANFALRRYLNERPLVEDTPAVFLTYKQGRIGIRAIQKRLSRYCQQAGITLTAHQLRHNFANDLVLADVPITTIQKLLGHAWVTTTELYLSANDPKVKADFYTASQQIEGWHNG